MKSDLKISLPSSEMACWYSYSVVVLRRVGWRRRRSSSLLAGLPHNLRVAETETGDPGLPPSTPQSTPILRQIPFWLSEKYRWQNQRNMFWRDQNPTVRLRWPPLHPNHPVNLYPLLTPHLKAFATFLHPLQLNLLRIWIFTRPHNLKAGLKKYIGRIHRVTHLKRRFNEINFNWGLRVISETHNWNF